MATDTQRLIVSLEASVTKFERALAKANGTANTRARSIERRFTKMNSVVSSQFSKLGGLFAGAVSVRGAQRLIDAATRIENALKVAGLSGDELAKVYGRLFDSAQKNAAPLEALVSLYGRAALAQGELNVSQEEMIGFADNVAKALRVSGQSAEQSRGALLQLAQAIGAGIVRGEEFNAILEGALPIAQAAAAGLKEAGGSVAKLRTLIIDGKVSSEAFFRAFEAGAVILEDKVASAEFTVSQGFVRLQNVLVDTAGKLDEVTGASERTARLISRVADVIETLGGAMESVADSSFGQFIASISESVKWLDDLEDSLGFVESRLALIRAYAGVFSDVMTGQITADSGPGPTNIGTITEGNGPPTINGVGVPLPGTKPPVPTQPVTLADYPITGGKAKKTRANDLQREIQQIKERTASLKAETAAQASFNPLVDDYGYTLTKAAAVQDLLNAAQKAGITITPQLREQIEGLAQGYADATVASAQMAEAQDKIRQSAEDMRALGKDVMSGFISDLRNGTSAADALHNGLNKVLDKLVEISLNSIFSGKGGGLGGVGLLGGLLIPGILHSGGVAGQDGYGHGRAVSPGVFSGAKRYHRGGVAGLQPGEVPAILQKGETVIPKNAGMGGAGNSRVVIELSPDLEARILQQAEGQSVRVVASAAPGIAADAQGRTLSSFTNGGAGEKIMRQGFGVSPKTRRVS